MPHLSPFPSVPYAHPASEEGMSTSRSPNGSVAEASWEQGPPKSGLHPLYIPGSEAALQISHSLQYNQALLHGFGFLGFSTMSLKNPRLICI